MIELTTGIVFLVSSLYGGSSSGTVPAASTTASTATTSTPVIEQTLSDQKILDSKTIQKYVREQYKDTPILVEVARCESTFNQFDKNGNVIRGKVNQYDVGVMQINEKYHLADSKKLGIDIYTLEGNVEYAKHLYADGGTDPWSASSKCWGKSVSDELAMSK